MADFDQRIPRRALGSTASARMRLSSASLIGIVIGVLVGLLTGVAYGVLAGWDVVSLVFAGSVWLTARSFDAAETERHAESEDPTRAGADAFLLSAALASLVAIGFVIGGAARSSGPVEFVRLASG